MTPAELLIARQKARLMRIEKNGMSEMARSYQAVLRNLNEHLAAITARIDQARAQGVEVTEWWLYRQERYGALIEQQEKRTIKFLSDCLATLESTKEKAIRNGVKDAPELAGRMMGPGPKTAVAQIEASFTKLPERQIDHMIRNAGNGRPLGQLLRRIEPVSTTAVKDALVSGVARGAPVREISRDVRKASNIAQNRALTITRQETMRVYRGASAEVYQSSDVIQGYTWFATLDARTCPACLAMHGEPLESPEIDSHICCRCTVLPRTKSWSDLGFHGIPDNRPGIQTGTDYFNGLTSAEQRSILGPSKHDLYRAGDIDLKDLVRRTHSREWGPGRRVATLAELTG